MKLFFNSKGQGNLKLSVSDFKTQTQKSVVTLTSISPELLKLLPKQTNEINKETTVEVKSSKATVQLFDSSVEVSFDPDEVHGNLDSFVSKINKQLDWVSSNKKLVDKVIVRDLLDLKNSKWLQEKEQQLSEESVLNKIRPISITFFEDISFEINFDDGNMFGGHIILVSVSKDKKVENATIEG
jgi:hypothetical protein